MDSSPLERCVKHGDRYIREPLDGKEALKFLTEILESDLDHERSRNEIDRIRSAHPEFFQPSDDSDAVEQPQPLPKIPSSL